MARWFRVLTALAGEQHPCQGAYNCLHLQLRQIQCPLLTSLGTWAKVCTPINSGNRIFFKLLCCVLCICWNDFAFFRAYWGVWFPWLFSEEYLSEVKLWALVKLGLSIRWVVEMIPSWLWANWTKERERRLYTKDQGDQMESKHWSPLDPVNLLNFRSSEAYLLSVGLWIEAYAQSNLLQHRNIDSRSCGDI